MDSERWWEWRLASQGSDRKMGSGVPWVPRVPRFVCVCQERTPEPTEPRNLRNLLALNINNPELHLHLSLPRRRDRQRPRVQILLDPSSLQREFEQCRAKRASEMGASLAPVQTSECKSAAACAEHRDIDTELRERLFARRGQVVRRGARIRLADPFEREHAIVQIDAERPGD